MKRFLTTTATILSIATMASAQNTNMLTTNNGFGAKTPLFDAIAGKFNLTANVGYVYNFANDWGGGDVVGKANGGLGYGGRIGWTNKSGFGVSADYLGFASKWKNDFEVTNNYHVVTFTPSYRISLGATKEWGLKLGLGVGFSLADVAWIGNKANANSFGSRVASGARYVGSTSRAPLADGITCGEDGAWFRRSYTDSANGLGNWAGANPIGANRCDNEFDGEVGPGLSDAQIAGFFTAGSLTASSSGVTATAPVSYGVWRRLFLNAPIANSTFFNVTAANANRLETRAAYITRCTSVACEGQAATAVGAARAVLGFETDLATVEQVAADAAAAVQATLTTTQATLTAAQAALTALADPTLATTNAAVLAARQTLATAQAAQATALAALTALTDPNQATTNVDVLAARQALATALADKATALSGKATAEAALATALAGKVAAEAELATEKAKPQAAKDDAGFVLAPEIALEYDNGMFHADINARYIHELFHVKYDGVSGAADQLQKSGPLAVFIGAGLGLNF